MQRFQVFFNVLDVGYVSKEAFDDVVAGKVAVMESNSVVAVLEEGGRQPDPVKAQEPNGERTKDFSDVFGRQSGETGANAEKQRENHRRASNFQFVVNFGRVWFEVVF